MKRLEHITPVLAQSLTKEGLATNPFRVSGLRVDLSGRKLDAAFKELGVVMDLNELPKHSFACGKIDESNFRQSKQRLKDSVQRICDECMWFWPLDIGAEDVALEHIANGQTDKAVDEWMGFLEHPEWGPIAAHNLAIVSLYECIESGAVHRNVAEQTCRFLESDACTARIRERMRALDDPRLPPSSARAFISEWRRALVTGQVKRGLAFIEGGNPRIGKMNIACASAIAEDDAMVGEIVEAELETQLRSLESRCQQNPESVTTAGWKSMAKETEQLLNRMSYFSQLEGRREIAGNEAANFLRRVSIHLYNKVDDRLGALHAAESALGLAVGATKEQISRDIDTIRESIDNHANQAKYEALVGRIDALDGREYEVPSDEIRALLSELNRLTDRTTSPKAREVHSILYNRLGGTVRGLAVSVYNTYKDISKAKILLGLADEILSASSARGMPQPELAQKLFVDRMTLSDNQRAAERSYSPSYGGSSYGGSSSGNNCLIALVALLCLTSAVSYAAMEASSAATKWLSHFLR
jgi:hypothetical protein